MQLYRFVFVPSEDDDHFTLALVPALHQNDAFLRGCQLLNTSAAVLAKQYWTRCGMEYTDEDVESAFFTVEEITTPDDLIACASTMLMEYAAVFPKEPTEEFSQTILNTLTT